MKFPSDKRKAELASRLRRRWAALARRYPPERRRRARIGAGAALLAALGALGVWVSGFAGVRVLNTGPDPVWLVIDGSPGPLLSPVTAETPEAGIALRLRPGHHRLAIEGRGGALIDAVDVSLARSGAYLFAPGPGDQCFWVQHTAYGQAAPELAPLRALPREQRIWSVPLEIDAWFFPTPPASRDDNRSSGGTRTAIRQTRCGLEPWR